MKIFTLLAAVAAITLITGPARADTVRTTTTVKAVDLPGVKKFDIESFDDNHDGVITVVETGDHLFSLFDLDSNDVLDNIEWTKKTIITVIPVQKQTVTFRDYNSDGQAETSNYSEDNYMKRSGLSAFSENKTGLSAKDFVKASFLEMDTNGSHVVEPDEWRAGYVVSHIPEVSKQYRYND